MIDVCLTLDAESSKAMDEGAVVHLHVDRDVAAPLAWLERFGAPLTVFLPLGELAATWPNAFVAAAKLAVHHDVGVHQHLPFGSLEPERIAEEIATETARVAEAIGRAPVSIRAGAFATGDQRVWIAAVAAAGLRVDSSVVAGASTEHGWEGARAAERESALFGGAGVSYDYRGAPIAGAYRVGEASLAAPGDGPLVEAPVSALLYDENEPRALVLDVHAMSEDMLLRGLEWLERISEGEGVAVVLAHSYGLVHHGRPTVVGRRLEAIRDWAEQRGARMRTLADLADDVPGPMWALNQDERWTAVDRSDLATLVNRPVARLSPTLLDARTEHVPFYGGLPPSRGTRYARVVLSVSGGMLAAAFVAAATPVAFLARRIGGSSSNES
jgi:peptidoglycan/xylan/chitin deacetylase (PgdA/CDA1 family)